MKLPGGSGKRYRTVSDQHPFENFWGNLQPAATLRQMIAENRIPQTLIFAGQGGLGKATLARRFGQQLLDHPEKIEQDDLSLPDNLALVQEREKLPANKRN